MKAKPFAKRLVSRTALLIEAAAFCVCSASTMAAVIDGTLTNIMVPQTSLGLYINVATNVANGAPANVPGWDLNPFGQLALSFFNPTAPAGGVYVVSGTTPVALNPGDTISAASTFGSGSGLSGFHSTQDAAYLGFRFKNELTADAINYGYARLSTTGPNGVPAVVVCYRYEDTGAPITVAACYPDLVFRNGFE